MYSQFKSNALKGFKWSFLNKFATQALQFIFSIILARLLSPDDYGMFAMITVFSSFGMLFTDFGFGQALIYKKENSKLELDSVFVLNVIIGLILSALFFILSPVISNFYDQPKLNNLIKVVSVIFLIQSFGLVNFIELKKRIDFKLLAIVENISLLLSSVVAIVFAYYGFGVWSLVFRAVINMVFRTIIVLFVSNYKPSFNFSLDKIKVLWKYSFSVTANGFLTYWMRNLDNLMIGKIIGKQALGVYNMAYQIMLLPIRNISNVIKDVLFPSFSSINNDIDRIRLVYLKVIQTIALVTFPLLAGFALLSESFVSIILGEKWLQTIPILSLLALVAIPQSIFTVNGVLYLNTGRPDIPLKINLISLPVYAIGFYLGLKYNGVIGLVYAYIIVYGIQIIPIYIFSAKNIKLPFLDFIRSLYPIVISTFFMCLIVWWSKRLMTPTEQISHFILCIIIGILSYSGLILLLRKKISITDILLERLKS